MKATTIQIITVKITIIEKKIIIENDYGNHRDKI